jgi:hypothetical protein
MALPPGATLVSDGSGTSTPSQDSGWRKVYDYTGLGELQKLAGSVSQWAQQKADQAKTQSESNAAKGGAPSNEYVSPRAGYDLLARTSGLVSGFLEPKNVAITGGVIAANTNPFTGIPVDLALVAHGGYGIYKNASAAVQGDPEAAERALMSASEMAGGAAGTAGQIRAVPRVVQNVKSSITGQPATNIPAEVSATAAAASSTPLPGKIAQTLGITDPPPNQLLTKAIKPLASNTKWDYAIAKAAPDMKAVETDLGHPISGVDDALAATSIAKKAIWNQYADKLNAAQQAFPNAPGMATIDGNEIADAMMSSIDKRTALQRPELVERVQKIADTYRRPMDVAEAEDFLQSANNDLHSYYAKNKVGQRVAAQDPDMGSTVAEAEALRSQLYSTLDNLTGPGAADLKQRYGALSNVENELLRRKNVSARQQPDSLAEQLSMARAYGKIAVGVARLSPSSLIEGTQSLAAAKWLKTRGTTDAMITRAFQALGAQPAVTAVPTPPGLGPNVPATIGAAAGSATGFRLSDLLGQ